MPASFKPPCSSSICLLIPFALKMSDVPPDVLRDIFLRLSADCLLRFRAVCKAWRRLIDDLSFVKAYNNQFPSNTLLVRTNVNMIYTFNLDSLDFGNGLQTIRVTPIKIHFRNEPRAPRLPFASCNGLVLISRPLHWDPRSVWAIWNPLTRQCHELPPPNACFHLIGNGFGYDYASDDYKVLRIYSWWRDGKMYVCQTHVYSLKSGLWRVIRDCLCDCPYACSSPGVSHNGALHWISETRIISFNLSTESYGQLPLPPIATTPPDFNTTYFNASGGCLVLSCFNSVMKCFDGWVMKNSGAEDSWVKLFSIKELDNISNTRNVRTVAFLKKKKQVFLEHMRGFIWFDIETNSVKTVSIHGFSDINSSHICPGSLFQLHDSCGVSGSVAAKRTEVKRKRKRRMADKRLTFCVRDFGVKACSLASCTTDCSTWSSESEDED